ncbi:hypothetical protein B0H17DRAFT_1151641 [Mycena rosella]|uniref:Uncharacterized protein n=1 Tax=Mycena rosella TaxID=1033263 RepID=A0AAD7FIQ5_MYCRO|nr:hypothetical protein B0H17DRAFT_1151641 [Mycena rosella]
MSWLSTPRTDAHPPRMKCLRAYVAFARADDALYVLQHAAVVCPEYAQCTLRFAPDLYARCAPAPLPALRVKHRREDADANVREREREAEEETRTLMAAEERRNRPLSVCSMRIAGLLGVHAESRLHVDTGVDAGIARVDADTGHLALGFVRQGGKVRYAPEEVERMWQAVEQGGRGGNKGGGVGVGVGRDERAGRR